MDALYIEGLSKTYSNGVHALKGIDLRVKEGDFFALLGPNGAGKSTTIGIITSLVNKSAGKVKIFGHDLDTDLVAAKRCLGVVPQEFNFSIFEKVIDIVTNQAGYYALDRKTAMERAEKFLKQLSLWEKRDSISKTLSGGMKRRLMIARALIHHPKLLILDEPTAGVDIEIRRDMWRFLTKLNQEGVTIILTTHYLEEAENLCRNIAIIDNGDIIENTKTKDLLGRLDREIFVFDLKEPLSKKIEHPKYPITLIDETTLEVEVLKTNNINEFFQFLTENQIQVCSMRNKSNRLEELFMYLVQGEKK